MTFDERWQEKRAVSRSFSRMMFFNFYDSFYENLQYILQMYLVERPHVMDMIFYFSQFSRL